MLRINIPYKFRMDRNCRRGFLWQHLFIFEVKSPLAPTNLQSCTSDFHLLSLTLILIVYVYRQILITSPPKQVLL